MLRNSINQICVQQLTTESHLVKLPISVLQNAARLSCQAQLRGAEWSSKAHLLGASPPQQSPPGRVTEDRPPTSITNTAATTKPLAPLRPQKWVRGYFGRISPPLTLIQRDRTRRIRNNGCRDNTCEPVGSGAPRRVYIDSWQEMRCFLSFLNQDAPQACGKC